MKKPKDPFLPLYFGDFLSATTEWTGEQQALYLLLLAYQWANKSLPGDPVNIAIVARYERVHFASLWPIMESKFELRDGRRRNERLEIHREKSQIIGSLRSETGRIGAEARWQAHRERVANASGSGGKRIKRHGKKHAVATKNDSKMMPSDPIRSDPIPTSSQDLRSSPSQTSIRTSKNGRSGPDPEREREKPAAIAKRRHDPEGSAAIAKLGARIKALS